MPPPPAELFASRIFLGPALRAQPDGRLVGLVREGYDSAFEEIVRRYRRPLERFAAAIVDGRSEDVTQDAFSKALLALRGSEAEIELRPWLYRIVRNTALNDLRDRGPVAEQLTEAMTAGGSSAAAEVERREELADLMKRLSALPEPQRAAIVMRELEGLSHEEIASALGVSGGAARQAIYRARAALRGGMGLLVPLPVLRALIDHGGDAARGGGAVAAGAGASSAGGAIGSLGAGGALKVGAATLLVAGTVAGGVAIEQHRGGGAQPEAAIAAPLDGRSGQDGGGPSTGNGAASGRSDDGRGDSRGHGGGPSEEGGQGGSSGPGSGVSGGRTRDGSGSSGEGQGGHHGGSGSGGTEGGDDNGGLQKAQSDDGGGDGSSGGSGGDDGGTSGSGGSDDGGGTTSGDSGDGGTSGSGSGESGGGETTTPTEPVLEETSGESGSGSGSDGSGDLSGGDVPSLDESP
jgi:RNA polymerase sigma factor (sigma-70 family)